MAVLMGRELLEEVMKINITEVEAKFLLRAGSRKLEKAFPKAVRKAFVPVLCKESYTFQPRKR
jgi:hypothetical protein